MELLINLYIDPCNWVIVERDELLYDHIAEMAFQHRQLFPGHY